jgi:Bardet-Biedl syndrome 2 protein
VQAELKNLADNLRAAAVGSTEAGLIPTNTRVTTALEVSRADRCVYLVVQASTPDARVRAVCVFADQLFAGESQSAHDSTASQSVRVRIAPAKDVEAQLRVNALVGGRGSTAYHVFELEGLLPRFAMYARAGSEDGLATPQSFVKFKVHERTAQVKGWVSQAFCPEVVSDPASGKFSSLSVVSLRTGRLLVIELEAGVLTVRTDEMETAGDIVQALCSFLKVAELESEADFPAEMAAFREVLQRVDELNAVRLKMTADMADSSNLIKQLVIRAEDARMLGEIGLMRKTYTQLHALNQELIGEYRKRTSNHDQLLEVRAPRILATLHHPSPCAARRLTIPRAARHSALAVRCLARRRLRTSTK